MPATYRTCDLAVMLDLSPDDVNTLARKGVIRGYKIGRRWRFRVRDVNRFLGKRPGGASPAERDEDTERAVG